MSEWISVKDRLPNDFNNVVFVYDVLHFFNGTKERRETEVGYYTKLQGFKKDLSETKYTNVTLWMPLPSLPEQL
jgi:hypothetical protein